MRLNEGVCFPIPQLNLPNYWTDHTWFPVSTSKFVHFQKWRYNRWTVHWVTIEHIQVQLASLWQLCITCASSIRNLHLGVCYQVRRIWKPMRGLYNHCYYHWLQNWSYITVWLPCSDGWYRVSPSTRRLKSEVGITHHFSLYSCFVHLPQFDSKVISVPVVVASPSSLAFDFLSFE